MTWNGYFTFDSVEVVNAERTETYAKQAGLPWFRPTFKNTEVHTVLGDAAYTDPLTDVAPWVDSRVAVSKEFYGFYPLDVAGIEDSTAASTPMESLGEGGTPGRVRRTTKSVVFNGVLVAASDAGAEFGLQWLKRTLTADGCTIGTSCTGHDLVYFAYEPHVGPILDASACSDRRATPSSDPDVVLSRSQRLLRGVQVITGAQVTSKRHTSDDSAVWTVQFTLNAGNSTEFGTTLQVLDDWLDPGAVGPVILVSGVTTDDVAAAYTEVECLPATYTPLYDPLAPAAVAPPSPPGIVWSTFDPPTDWDRYKVVLPASLIPAWSDVAPILRISAPGEDIRNVRIRFYPDPDEDGDINTGEDCDFDGDMLVGWIPTEGTMTLDGMDRVVYMDTVGDVRRRADSLVFSSNGDPYEWPVLTCGVQYVMMLDVPTGVTPPFVDLDLVERFL